MSPREVQVAEVEVVDAAVCAALGAERDAIEAFVGEALGEPAFSLAEEVARPFARVTALRDDARRVVALLVVWEVADELQILSVAVAPSARRRGLGRALVAEAVERGRRDGRRVALLEVRRSNVAAIRLYRRLGFFALGVRRGYYGDGEDAVELALPLSAEGAALVAERDAALERELEG